jgi:hypothetical protein
MKHLFFILIFSAIALPQELPTKGDISLGGSFLFAKNNYPNGSSSILSFSPEFSYFASTNFEAGIAISIQSSDYSDSRNNTTIGIGPFLTTYFKTTDIKPFVGISYSYVSTKFKYGSDTILDDYENSIGLFGGILVPLNLKLAISPIVRYSFYFGQGIQLGDITQIMFGVGFKAFL